MEKKKLIRGRPDALNDKIMHYCPGCGHGIVHRIVAEVVDELGIKDRFVGIAPVGCSVFAYWYFNTDFHQAAHGRAPAVASGIKRARPELIVMSYQGDGDLAAIGTAEIVHAANRGENITVIFINNAIYGMTGGQMAPTTLIGQKSTTTPLGRDPRKAGFPIKISEMLAVLPGSRYIERTTVTSPKEVNKTKKAIKKAFELQMKGEGFTMVEVLSPCPTNWRLTPKDALKFVEEKMVEYYPLGVFKDEPVFND